MKFILSQMKNKYDAFFQLVYQKTLTLIEKLFINTNLSSLYIAFKKKINVLSKAIYKIKGHEENLIKT